LEFQIDAETSRERELPHIDPVTLQSHNSLHSTVC